MIRSSESRPNSARVLSFFWLPLLWRIRDLLSGLPCLRYGGSVGAAVFGIGGIQPFSSPSWPRTDDFVSVAPIPWLPDAPRGAAVWRSRTGVISASWAAITISTATKTRPSDTSASGAATSDAAWHVWVNVTVPPTSSSTGANISVMLPSSATPGGVCAWECGQANGVGEPVAYTTRWISFDSAGGHEQLSAVVPPADAASAPEPSRLHDSCTPLWSSGTASKQVPEGVLDVIWAAARPGYTLYPSITLTTTSGAYAVFAEAC